MRHANNEVKQTVRTQRFLPSLCCIYLLPALTLGVHAQPTPTPPAAAAPPAPAAAQPAANPTTTPATAVVLNSITISDQAKPAARPPGVDASAVPLLNDPELLGRLKAFLNRPLTRGDLLDILGDINTQLATSGNSFTVASLPEQDLTDGTLTVLITRGRVGKINIKNIGADTFTEARYRSLLSIKPGELLSQSALDADVDWIGRSNGYRSATVITEASKTPGATDLSFMVNDRKPFSFSATADNSGARTTGRERLTLTAGWGNVFDSDHQASYTLTGNPKFDRLASHNFGYVIPLASRDVLSLSANVTDVKSDLGVPFDSKGKNLGLGARYDMTLKNLSNYKHGINIGLDFKRSNNNLLFGGLQVTNTSTDIFQLNLGYRGTLQDSYGQTTVGLNWVQSPGGLSERNKDATFTQSRFAASARYNYQVLTLDRQTPLPDKWNWSVNGRFQFTNNNLLGSEQLAAGGVGSVRAFADAIAFGDRGYVLRTELQSPFAELGKGASLTRVQGLVFIDHAKVGNATLLPGETPTNQLSSAGFGARVALPKNVSLRLDAGRQYAVSTPGARLRNLVHFSLSVAL